MSPRRWYLWAIQQAAVLMVLAGVSVKKVSEATGAARSTIRRWSSWLVERFNDYRNVLVGHAADLGRAGNQTSFWQACLSTISLAQAMRLCHVAGVDVP